MPVYLINAAQDGTCEDDDVIQKYADQMPSFKSKTTLDPADHMIVMAPTGTQGDKMVDAIISALQESGSQSLAVQLFATLTLLSLY